MAKNPSNKKGEKAEATEAPAYNADLLASIVAATRAEQFVYTGMADNAALLADGLVEVNENLTNEAGEVATRATAKGIEIVNLNTQPAVEGEQAANETPVKESAPASARPQFAVEDGIPVPTAKRGVGAGLYPFDTMSVNQSFFVPATAEKPTPAKSLASTVSSATKRYAETDKRQFVVRSVEGGARVWRTA